MPPSDPGKKIFHFLLVSKKDYPDQDLFCHGGTLHTEALDPSASPCLAEVHSLGAIGRLLATLLGLVFITSGGNMVSFPFESFILPFLLGEESGTSS